jgi:hypothetical protein
MKKFLIPATLLIASTLGGAAFAGSMPQAQNDALYGEPNPFAAVQTPTTQQLAYNVNMEAQQASRAYVPQGGWSSQAPAAGENQHDPE